MSAVTAASTAPSSRFLSFRPPLDEDFEVLAGIRRDAALQGLLMTVPETTDDAAVRAWIERRSRDESGLFHVIAETATGRALGYLQISQVHRRNRTGYGAIAISSQARMPGVGQAAMRALLRAATEDLHLCKLMAEIRIDNFPAIQLNMAAGYRVIGTLEKHFRGLDRTYDALLLERCLTPC